MIFIILPFFGLAIFFPFADALYQRHRLAQTAKIEQVSGQLALWLCFFRCPVDIYGDAPAIGGFYYQAIPPIFANYFHFIPKTGVVRMRDRRFLARCVALWGSVVVASSA